MPMYRIDESRKWRRNNLSRDAVRCGQVVDVGREKVEGRRTGAPAPSSETISTQAGRVNREKTKMMGRRGLGQKKS